MNFCCRLQFFTKMDFFFEKLEKSLSLFGGEFPSAEIC